MDIRDLERFSPGDWFYDVRDQLKRHIYGRHEACFAAGDAARAALASPADVRARQEAVRSHFVRSIGGLPATDTPLMARTVGEIRENGFRIEKVLFQSRPRHYVTANLYLPDGMSGPQGAVLFLCGHHGQAKHEPEYQRVCRTLVGAGLIVMAQDPIGQGERYSYHEPSLAGETVPPCCPDHDYAGAQCLPAGESLARYFAHDAMRGIDYLRSRPAVDPDRIGVTGNSGGGTQTCLVMLADPRIAAAAPATFVMSRRSYMYAGGAQDAEQIWPGFTAHGFDHADVLLCMAPRPVRVLAVTGDFFPIEGTRDTVRQAERIWSLFGREGMVDLVEDAQSHFYAPKLARAAAGFFARHLLDRDVEPTDPHVEAVDPPRLWCTTSGQVRGEIADAEFVHDAVQARVTELAHEREALPPAERRERALAWLRERVVAHRKPRDLNPRFILQGRVDEMAVEGAIWWAQEGLFSHAILFRHSRDAGRSLPVTLALWDGGTDCLQPHLAWLRAACESGRAAMVLDTSGVGGLSPRPITPTPDDAFYGTLHKLASDLHWLDDDLPALRTYDTLRALDMVGQWPGLDASDIRVYACGRHGLYGRLAALLDPRIRDVAHGDGMASFAEWVAARHYDTRDIYSVVLRGVLRHLDLPEIEGRR